MPLDPDVPRATVVVPDADEVLRLLRSPLTQREIANELFVSFNTTPTHTKAIHPKLGVAGRSEAIAAARRAELL